MHGHRFAGHGALLGVLVAGGLSFAALSRSTPADDVRPPQDSAFAALQARGEQAMGVNQYTSTHVFDALPNGGRIELQRDVDDSAGVEQIRRHLAHIAEVFDAGDFSTPAFVHLGEVPGASVMAARRDRIEYFYRDLPRGGEVRIVTDDPEAVRAIHEFMAFQREQHRSGGTHGGAADHQTMHERMMRHHHMQQGARADTSAVHGASHHRTHGAIPPTDTTRGASGRRPPTGGAR
jgi:hypothetical protein